MKKWVMVLAALMTVTICVPAFGAENATKVIRIGHIQNVDHPIHLSLLKFAELVKKNSGGSLEVQVYPNSQLGSAITMVQSVKAGALEGFLDGLGWYGQYVGEYFLPATAYAMKDIDQVLRLMKSSLGKEMDDKLLKMHGIKMINATWIRMPRQLLATKPIKTPDDVKGLKLRIPELASYVVPWKELGAQPTPIALAEVYLALQQGVVDACELPIDMIYTQKLHEVAKNLILTAHQSEPSGLIMNGKFFNNLTPKEQKVVFDAAEESAKYNNKLSYALEKELVAKMKAGGTNFITVDREAFRDRVKNAPYILEDKGVWPKGFYDRAKVI
jgi:TRAP-type transport system periplasmic protein